MKSSTSKLPILMVLVLGAAVGGSGCSLGQKLGINHGRSSQADAGRGTPSGQGTDPSVNQPGVGPSTVETPPVDVTATPAGSTNTNGTVTTQTGTGQGTTVTVNTGSTGSGNEDLEDGITTVGEEDEDDDLQGPFVDVNTAGSNVTVF
jgi:hypothetical protein